MKFCIKCGRQFPDKESLCPDCRHKLSSADSEEVMRLILHGRQSFEDGDSEAAASYFEEALKLEHENEAAEDGLVYSNNDIKGIFRIAEATVTPEKRLEEILKSFASDKDIVPDIYKEIKIESVTAKYYMLLGGTTSADYVFSEAKDSKAYSDEYDSFTFPYDLTEGKTADGEQSRKLMIKFDAEICSRTKISYLKRYNPYELNEADGKLLYHGIESEDYNCENITKYREDSAYAQYTDFKNRCMKKAGRDTIIVTNNRLSGKATIIYFPVMTVVYSYRGQKYVALADLYFKKPVFYKTYPVLKGADEVEEEARKVNKLPASRKAAPKGGIVLAVIGVICFALYLLSEEAYFAVYPGITFLLFGIVIDIVCRKKFKKASAAVYEATSRYAEILKNRENTLSSQYDTFFKSYAGVDSVKSAQSRMPAAESSENFRTAVFPEDAVK